MYKNLCSSCWMFSWKTVPYPSSILLGIKLEFQPTPYLLLYTGLRIFSPISWARFWFDIWACRVNAAGAAIALGLHDVPSPPLLEKKKSNSKNSSPIRSPACKCAGQVSSPIEITESLFTSNLELKSSQSIVQRTDTLVKQPCRAIRDL